METSPVNAIRNDGQRGFPCDEDDALPLLRVHDVQSLYCLAFLLTADTEKAKQCFVTGIEDVDDENVAFREWAHVWARRVIIESAVSLIKPWKGVVPDQKTIIHSRPQPVPDQDGRISVARLLGLDDFERFVFVLQTIEGYPPKACSTLLECPIEVLSDVPLSTDRLGRGLMAIWRFGNANTSH